MFCTIFVYILKTLEMKRYIILILMSALSLAAAAQEKIGDNLEIDKSIHDFGDVLIENGPVSCTFTVKNIGQTPAVIYNVVSSCGCTDVKWTREPLRPGSTGKISVTYSNDEGAYPFDKTLTVYFSDVKKPYILKVRGVAHEKKKSLEELYGIRIGQIGMKETYLKCGNIEQGGMRSDFTTIANLSDKPVKIDFTDVSDNLILKVSPNPIPARSTAELEFTVKASRDKWGRNDYWAVPLIDGKSYTASNGDKRLGFWAFTKEDFKGLTEDEKSKGPRPMFESSTWSFGKIKAGDTVHATFEFTNKGSKTFCVYKVDINACKWSHSEIPVAKPGETVKFRVHLDTANMPKGEALTIVTLTTNSPLRPIVNLFISGWIE